MGKEGKDDERELPVELFRWGSCGEGGKELLCVGGEKRKLEQRQDEMQAVRDPEGKACESKESSLGFAPPVAR